MTLILTIKVKRVSVKADGAALSLMDTQNTEQTESDESERIRLDLERLFGPEGGSEEELSEAEGNIEDFPPATSLIPEELYGDAVPPLVGFGTILEGYDGAYRAGIEVGGCGPADPREGVLFGTTL
ncbi:hypothetical protein R1sor_010482 [Riccia sorocarpa]|uniref:Uncharacterized protein n=1 Tax=Riccia sorocarpa TaxID=122646 RepID=A0ABD3HZK5_9MARC